MSRSAAPAVARRATFVPVFPDGMVGVVRTGTGFALPSGVVADDEDDILDVALRVLLETAGFRRQALHVFAIDAGHVFAWAEGDEYHGRRPHARVALEIGEPAALESRLRASGAIDVAEIVGAAMESYRTVNRDAFMAEHLAALERAYLAAATTEGGSGFGGTPDEWRAAREPITDAIDWDGTFLDLGCANGLLMESVRLWCGERGVVIEPYGVDVAVGLVQRARERLPQWTDRIWVGDAATWTPARGMRFDYVHTLLDVVAPSARRDLVAHALRALVRPGGRLLVSHYARSVVHDRSAADQLRALGFVVAGESRPVAGDEHAPPTTAWLDAP
jgi:2-polyprenyl-3-methyl-5-hydroxy-6-metoxy-1,4-benzoquinol methylase